MKNNNSLFLGLIMIISGIIGIFGTSYFTPRWTGMENRMDFRSMDSRQQHFYGQKMMENGWSKRKFSSNGQRIYYRAESNSKKPIKATIGTMGMSPPMMSCVSCHGEDGQGGTVQMMMGSFKAPNITYKELTKAENPPYTDKLIKRAITKGIDAGGKRLEPPMPKWSMSDKDLNDLIDYLKTL